MTVSTTDNTVVYRGNGATTAFAVPFKVLDVDHLVVRRRIYATGVFEYTYIGTDYDYSGLGDSAGTLTLDGAALDDDYELVIERIVPYTQDLDIVNAGGFYPETVEEQLDLIVMAIQQLADLTGRSLRLSPGETADDLLSAEARIGGKILGFDTITGAPELLDAEDFKGDPGGNVMAVGLFSALPLMTIDADITMIRTSGWSVEGVGEAWYKYDATVTEATVTQRPESHVITADGRGWRLSRAQIVTDYMFGAIDGADNATALEKWSNFVWTFKCLAGWARSEGTSNREVSLGGTSHSKTKQLSIGIKLAASAAMNVLLTLNLTRYCTIDWSGCELRGINNDDDAVALTSRLARVGLVLDTCQRTEMTGVLTCYNFYYWAVAFPLNGINGFASTPYIRAFSCGSSPEYGSDHDMEANWSAPVRNGSASSLAQTTTLTVDVAPLADPMNMQRCVKLNNYYYSIESITGTGPYTLTLSMPWIDSTSYAAGAGSGALDYVFGGMLAIRGGDTARSRVRGDAVRCGFGVLDQALYGADILTLGSSVTTILLGFGIGTNSSQVGGKLHGGYLEDGNTARVLSFSDDTLGREMGEIGGEGLLDFARFYKHGPRNASEVLTGQRMDEFALVTGVPNFQIIAQQGVSFTATYNPGSIAAGASESTTISIPTLGTLAVGLDARFAIGLGGLILFAAPGTLASSGNVTANVTFFNPTAAPIDIGEGQITLRVRR